jgi:cytochrome c553
MHWSPYLVLFLVAGAAVLAAGAITPDQKKQLVELKKEVDKTTSLISKGKFDEAQKLLDEAEQKARQIASDAQDEKNKQIEALLKQIEARRTALARKKGGGAGGASFEKDVAPILVKHCLRCHGEEARGGLRFDTFQGIVDGCNGKLVVPSNPAGSMLLMRVTAAPDQRMPKGGKALSQEEIRALTSWIAAGAKFEGNNAIPLSELAVDSKKPDAAPVQIARATGNEKVSFTRDIAPFMVNLCLNCHSGRNPRAGFSLETFENLMRGGKSGRVVLPGNTKDSRLWQLAGEQEPLKMPPGQALLTVTNWNNLRTWIEEGAKFDGENPKALLRTLVPTDEEKRRREIENLSPEELTLRRKERAAELWTTAFTNEQPQLHQSASFFVAGNATAERLKEIADWAEEEASLLAKVFHVADAPLWKGRLIIFVFKDKFSYTEFCQSNERREPLADQTGHARVTAALDEAYVAQLDLGDGQSDDEAGMRLVLSSRLAEAFLQRFGKKLPRFVTSGTGLALAGRGDPKNGYLKALGQKAARSVAELDKPQDVLADGTFSPNEVDAVAYALVAYMLKQGEPQYVKFVNLLLSGKSLDDALKTVYNADGLKLATAFISGLNAARPGARKSKK